MARLPTHTLPLSGFDQAEIVSGKCKIRRRKPFAVSRWNGNWWFYDSGASKKSLTPNTLMFIHLN